MKNLKHVVFALLISFLFIVNVSAKTTYKCNDGDEYYSSGMCRKVYDSCPDGYKKTDDNKCIVQKKCSGNYTPDAKGRCSYSYVTTAKDTNGNLYCNKSFAATTEQDGNICTAVSNEKPTCPEGSTELGNYYCQTNMIKKYGKIYKAQVVTTSDSNSSSSSSTSSSSKSSSSKKKTTKKSSSSITIKCLDKGFNVDKEKQKVLPVFIKNKNNKPISVSTGSKKIKVEMSGNYIYVTGLKKATKVYAKVTVGSKSVKCPVQVNKKDTQTVELNNAESEANKVLSDSPQTNTSGNASATKKGSKELKKIKCNGTFTNFDKLTSNGTEIADSNYDKESGSTVVTLKNSYLDSLSEGTYKLAFVYNDGRSAETNLTIAKASGNTNNENNNNEDVNKQEDSNTNNNQSSGTTENTSSITPKTGDSITLWIALLVVAALGTVGTVRYIRKRD